MKSDFIKMIEGIEGKKVTDFKLNQLLMKCRDDWKGVKKEKIIRWIREEITKSPSLKIVKS
jgi:hypothetical protein